LKPRTNFFVVIILILVVGSCSHIEQKETTLSETINPGTCRIAGTIISIDDSKDFEGICSTQPCVATVRIDNILKRGMGFTNTLSKNSIIQLKFEYTLQPTTKEMFPKLNYVFPGLKIGEKFRGDVEEVVMIKMEATETDNFYKIYNYDKIN